MHVPKQLVRAEQLRCRSGEGQTPLNRLPHSPTWLKMSRRQRPEHNYYFDKAAETTADSLAVLAEYRRTGTRNSGDVVKRGEKVLSEKGALRKLGDEGVSRLQSITRCSRR